MDYLPFDYRDPLYGIILLFAIVFIIHISNYWARFFKKREDENRIKKFVKNIEISANFSEYKDLILKKDLPIESIILMALSYERSGEFDKAIEIYLTLLEKVKDTQEKQYLLTLLGKCYYKAGFLYKSKDILLTTLKLNPKNEEALTYLISILENLREYDKAIEVLDVLEMMMGDLEEKKLYFKVSSILHSNLDDEQKVQKVIELGTKNRIVQRKLFEYVLNRDIKIPKEILIHFDFNNLIDLIWEMDKKYFDRDFIEQIPLLQQIYTAKKKYDLATKSENFELNILIKLKDEKECKADLSFTYTCKRCKNIFPLYFYRCPVCKNIDSTIINTTLIRRDYETDSFV